jgi:hypothetical protein
VDHSGPPTVSPCGESDLHDIFDRPTAIAENIGKTG